MKPNNPHRLSDYAVDPSTGRIKLIRRVPVKKATRVTMAEFLRSDISTRKRTYLRALEESANEQDKLIEMAAKAVTA